MLRLSVVSFNSRPTIYRAQSSVITRRMLWIGCCFFCPVTDTGISATVAPIGVTFCMMVGLQYRPRTDLPFWQRYGNPPPGDLQIRNYGA